MIDFHCHLDLYPDAVQVAQDCQRRGLSLLSVTTTPSAWRGTLALASGADQIETALGLHPQIAHERESELPVFDQLLPQVRYVGEIGLDGSPEFRRNWHSQVSVFEHILEACSRAGGRILSLHSRRASQAVLDTLEAFPNAGVPILHWFSGSFRDLERAIKLGCWFSVGPAMFQSKQGHSIVERLPHETVLTESDGPFARVGGKSLMPWQVDIALLELSKIWSLPSNKVEEMLQSNLAALHSRDSKLGLR